MHLLAAVCITIKSSYLNDALNLAILVSDPNLIRVNGHNYLCGCISKDFITYSEIANIYLQ